MKNFLQNFFLCIHSFEENVLNPMIINSKNSGEEICPKESVQMTFTDKTTPIPPSGLEVPLR